MSRAISPAAVVKNRDNRESMKSAASSPPVIVRCGYAPLSGFIGDTT